MAAVLLQAVHSAPDTIVTKQVGGELGIFQKIGIISQAVITLVALLLAVALFMVAWYFRGIYLKVTRIIDQVDGIVVQARDRIDHVHAFLGVIQEEAESVFVEAAATVRGVRTGLRQALDHNEGDNDGDDNSIRTTYASPPGPRVNPQWNEDEDT
jgi:hypothetical protein